MQSSPEATELAHIFAELDEQKVGYLTLNQFAAYIEKQPRKLPNYILNDLFHRLPDEKMNQQAFIVYVMGYRMNLEQLALSRFAMQKELGEHASASPSSGANEVRKNLLKFSVASKKSLAQGEKHKLGLSFGRDEKGQTMFYEEIEQVLGRKPEEILGVIKFKVTGAHEQIRSGLETVLETAKGILTEMDEQLFRIIDLFKFSVKGNGNYIYIIVQVGHVFLVDTVNFLNELIQSLSPDALVQISAFVQSNYMKDFLKEGSEKKMEDLQVHLGLNIDDQTLKKIKQMVGDKANYADQNQEFVGTLFLLLQQVSLEASFSNSQKLFTQLGLGQNLTQSKAQLGALKEMSILETMEGFIPQSKELIENLKKYDGKGDWEISINLRNVYLRLEFNLEIEGIFDLF